jgi:hypothetical protein
MENGADGRSGGRIGVINAFNLYGANVLAEKNEGLN